VAKSASAATRAAIAATGAFEGLALHAARLAFDHPADATRRSFEAPRPAPFAALVGRLEASEAGTPEDAP
jgi:hypothetical protein